MQTLEARYFLAHRRTDEDADVDNWVAALAPALSTPEWVAMVTPGRDDYRSRASSLGGWKAWCKDVPSGSYYDGQPLFHGIIVPADADLEEPTIGRATVQLVEGFILSGKIAYVWCPRTGEFRRIVEIEGTDQDDWKAWGRIILDTMDNGE